MFKPSCIIINMRMFIDTSSQEIVIHLQQKDPPHKSAPQVSAASSYLKILPTQKANRMKNNGVQYKIWLPIFESASSIHGRLNFKEVKPSAKAQSIYGRNAINKKTGHAASLIHPNIALLHHLNQWGVVSSSVGLGLPHNPSLHQIQSRSPHAL